MTDFELRLANELMERFSDPDVEFIVSAVQRLQSDFDIIRKQVEIVPYVDTLPECYMAFMVAKKLEGKSEATLYTYRLALEAMLRTIRKPVGDIQTNDLRLYLFDYQRTHHVSNRTLDTRRLIFSSFFGWSRDEGYIQSNPATNIAPIKFTESPRQPLTDIQLELIRDACETPRERAIVEVLYSTGCRISELARIKRSEVDIASGEIQVLGKGSKIRTVYLNAKATVALTRYFEWRRDDCDALIVSDRRPYHPIQKEAMERIVKTVGERAGVRLHPHLMRHTMATDFLERSGNVAELRTLLGHAKVETSMIYAKVAQDSTRSDHRRFII